jgi:hypothetical protein
MPIFGIMASQASAHLWSPSNSYDSIATTTVGAGGVASITFSSIPSTYRHLQIRLSAQTNQANFGDGAIYRFNGDTANNYTLHWLSGDGASASALAIAPYGGLRIAQLSGNDSTNVFGAAVIDILDYANTNKFKTGKSLDGYDRNGGGQISLASGVWMNTTAVNSITLTVTGGSAWKQYTSAALYGIK